MNRPPADAVTCSVVDGAKLPAESGGAEALCSAIEQAVTARAPNARASVVVRVMSPSMLAANVTTAAGALPEQKFASSDRDLTRSSFERFARALADQIARTGGR